MPHELGDRANPDYIAGFLDGHTHHQVRALYCSLTQEEESLKLSETKGSGKSTELKVEREFPRANTH